jgi:IMP dehydrogenase
MSIQEYKDIAFRWSEKFGFSKPLALSVGLVSRDEERILFCIDQADIICVDVAHGDTTQMIETLQYIREKGFTGPVIAGNVCTPEGTSNLSIGGADLIKVGVGPGSVCTTRVKTGCGYPQLQAIALCGGEAPIIADGGIKTPGDVAKALAAGARVVMIGGLLAGTDCVPGWDEGTKNWEVEAYEDLATGKKMFPPNRAIKFRGMASKEAREEMGFAGINAEGISTFVKCKEPGSTEAVINDIVEGIKSAMSYTGAENLEVFKNKAKFVRVTTTSQLENRPHFSG